MILPTLLQTMWTLIGNTLSLFPVLLSPKVLVTIKGDSVMLHQVTNLIKRYSVNDYRSCRFVKDNLGLSLH